jgi:hypothetical protein
MVRSTAGSRSGCRPTRRCEGAAVKSEILGSHAAPVQSTSGDGFDLRDLRNASARSGPA